MIKPASKSFKSLPDSIGAEYKAGASGEELAAKYEYSWSSVRKKLLFLGIAIRPQGFPADDALNGGRKINQEAHKQIAKLHLSGMAHAEIGRRFGISRERVRQIVASLNLPVRWTFVKKRVSDRLRAEVMRRRERDAEKRATIQKASRFWKRGAHWSEIAQLMNWECVSSTEFHACFGHLRSIHRSKFPPRRPDHWRIKERR